MLVGMDGPVAAGGDGEVLSLGVGWTSILSIRHCIHCGASATKTPVITGVKGWM